MNSGYSTENHVPLFLIIVLSIFGCVTPSEIKKPSEYKVFTCKSVVREGQKSYARDKTNKFIIGEGENAYVFAEFFDLTPGGKYVFKWKVYDPKGEFALTRTHEFRPKKSRWNAFFRLSLDPKHERASGLWSVKLYVNESYITTASFYIAENEEVLAGMISGGQTQEYSVYEQPFPTKQLLYPQAVGQKWAVIIGISRYKDTRIQSLRYAAKDANSFYSWLISPTGGMYAPSRVRLLLNQNATARNMKQALFQWLGQALEEDIVTIYFAGHGSPQSPDHPDNLFLLPYDAQYDSIATTGFPMWDIETALRRFIKARRVIVIADACHAGGVGLAFDIARRANRAIEVNPIGSGLQNLVNIGDGIAVISASDDRQFSQESKNWGGGHGVFTYFLLSGLKGEADYNKDQSVTLGELIPYLSEQVRRATKNAQSPTVAGKFDPALTIGR